MNAHTADNVRHVIDAFFDVHWLHMVPEASDRTHENILVQRYASREMAEIWSSRRKYVTWRKLWLALAEAQSELGLSVSPDQVQQLRSKVEHIDFKRAAELECETQHDVVAHIRLFGESCPLAQPIIHLGATSCFVTDNCDLLLIRESLELVGQRLAEVVRELARFSNEYADLPCLGYTHFQPAQLVTVGKRATMWCWDLLADLQDLEFRLDRLQFRGIKGATGTQSSFLTLVKGDHDRVKKLEELIATKMGFNNSYQITGQTYSRKIDTQVLDVVSGIADSCTRFATDVRLMAHCKELEEPTKQMQVGSSAMPYKQNPIQSERMNALARYVSATCANARSTHASQWLERSLDDSANRRLVLPQAFLSIDGVLCLYLAIAKGLVVHRNAIARNIEAELPFIAIEQILIDAVLSGEDRQKIHELLRQHCRSARNEVQDASRNNLIAQLRSDPAFSNVVVPTELRPIDYIGRSREQVSQFVQEAVPAALKRWPH